MTKKKYFPCPVCKGEGGWCDDRDDLGNCMIPIECGYCKGEGMIEIGGKIHRENKRVEIALIIIDFIKPKQEEFSYKELQDIGEKALKLIK